MNTKYKKTILGLLITLGSLNAQSANLENIQNVCGLSDTIYNYIADTVKEKSKTQVEMSSLYGSMRRLIIYNDNSWILTIELLSRGEIAEDKSCIIAKGDQSNVEMATDIMKKPTWIGPSSTEAQGSKEKAPTKKNESTEETRPSREQFQHEA